MSIAKWNNDWEPHDPLRGRRGWTRRRYLRFGFGLIFIVILIGLFVTTIVSIRQRKLILDMQHKIGSDWIHDTSNDSLNDK